jgi:hypothetical protein
MFDPGGDRRRKARERTRRYRARLADYKVVAPVEVGHDETELLVALGWLALAESEDRNKVGAAISAMLREAAKPRHA